MSADLEQRMLAEFERLWPPRKAEYRVGRAKGRAGRSGTHSGTEWA